MLPLIYDTKYISIETRKLNKDMKDLYDSTMLESLYNSLNRDVTKKFGLYMPTIKHSQISINYSINSHPHEAGYDAFMCGSGSLLLL
jgi:hypothetical protein